MNKSKAIKAAVAILLLLGSGFWLTRNQQNTPTPPVGQNGTSTPTSTPQATTTPGQATGTTASPTEIFDITGYFSKGLVPTPQTYRDPYGIYEITVSGPADAFSVRDPEDRNWWTVGISNRWRQDGWGAERQVRISCITSSKADAVWQLASGWKRFKARYVEGKYWENQAYWTIRNFKTGTICDIAEEPNDLSLPPVSSSEDRQYLYYLLNTFRFLDS